TSVTGAFPNESWSYSYDELHRLTVAAAGGPSTPVPDPSLSEAFTYDAIGRMTSNQRVGSYAYPSPGEPRPHAPTAAGGFGFNYDANGNLLTGAGRTLTWNPDN